MGLEEVMIVLLMAFSYAYCAASLGPLGLTTLPLVHVQGKNVEPKLEASTKYLNNYEHGENIIARHGRKLKHAIGSRGVNGGEMAGNSEAGHGGGRSNSPDTHGGGAAVIPLYAGGAAANMHHNNKHHSSASSVHICGKSGAPAAILLAYLLWYVYILY